MLLRLIEFAIICGGLVFMYKVLRKVWKCSELTDTVADKLDEIEQVDELSSKVIDIDHARILDRKKKLEDFNKL